MAEHIRQIRADQADRYRECGAVLELVDPQPEKWDNFPLDVALVPSLRPVQPGDVLVFECDDYPCDIERHGPDCTCQQPWTCSRAVVSVAPVLGRDLTDKQLSSLTFTCTPLRRPAVGDSQASICWEGEIRARRIEAVMKWWNTEHPDQPWDRNKHYWHIELDRA